MYDSHDALQPVRASICTSRCWRRVDVGLLMVTDEWDLSLYLIILLFYFTYLQFWSFQKSSDIKAVSHPQQFIFKQN